MSRICVTGKHTLIGNNRSYALNATKRRFLPNLHYHRFWIDSEKRFITLRVSAKGMRIIDKKGIEVVLSELRNNKYKFPKRSVKNFKKLKLYFKSNIIR